MENVIKWIAWLRAYPARRDFLFGKLLSVFEWLHYTTLLQKRAHCSIIHYLFFVLALSPCEPRLSLAGCHYTDFEWFVNSMMKMPIKNISHLSRFQFNHNLNNVCHMLSSLQETSRPVLLGHSGVIQEVLWFVYLKTKVLYFQPFTVMGFHERNQKCNLFCQQGLYVRVQVNSIGNIRSSEKRIQGLNVVKSLWIFAKLFVSCEI